MVAMIVGTVVWLVVLPVMTVVLGVPAALWVVVRRSKGAVLGLAGWVLAVRWGWVPAFGGPFGLPTLVFWPAAVVFGGMWVWGFWVLSRSAWSRAVEVRRLMEVYGMPAREIV